MDVRRGREGKRSLKKHIAVIIALITVMTFMVPVYSEPVNNEPGQPGIENPAPQPEAGDPGVQEPVADPNADNTVPVADPNANPAVDPNVTPGTDPNAVPGTEADLQIPENTGLENIPGYDDNYVAAYDDIFPEDEGELYTGPFDETEAVVTGSVSTGSLQRLINEAVPGEETRIELNKDTSISAQLNIGGGRKIIIDLKGHSLLSTGRGRSIRSAGFYGKYDIFVSGNGTVLKLEDSVSPAGSRGRYCVSENNGIAVCEGATFEVMNASLELNDDLYYLASASNGGTISVSRGTVSGNLDNGRGGSISLSGGKYSVEPDPEFLAPGYGYVVYKTAPLYRYEVRKKTKVYIKPAIEDGYVINNITLSECGIKKEMYDEEGKRIGGAKIAGGRFVETDEDGSNPRTLSSSTVFSVAGAVHYMTVMNDEYPDEIEISDAADKNVLLTDIYEILNGSEADRDSLTVFTSEDPSLDTLLLELKENKGLYYGRKVDDLFDIFDLTYIHKGVSNSLNKDNNVRFTFGLDEETAMNGTEEESYRYFDAEPGSTVYVCAEYRGTKAAAAVTVKKQPVVIVGKDESTLVGEKLSHRYYQKISVYPIDEDGTVRYSEPISENAALCEWTDATSSVLDLTGITNDEPGSYEKVELSDVYRLNDEKSREYELIGRGYLKYTVEPSIILDFRTPDGSETIADRRILESDSKTCIIGKFKNGKPSSDVRWMVKEPDNTMVDSSEAGITVKPANNGNGAVFTFDDSIAEKGGGSYTIYEVESRIKISGRISEDKNLSVAPISPVIYDGNKFAASDDLRYYADGAPKKGYSPVLDVKVYDGKKKLEIGKDYVLSYRYNKKAQEPGSKKSPVVTITGKGDYAGAKIRAYFTIMP